MKTAAIKIIMVLAIFCGLVLPVSVAAEGSADFKTVSMDIVRFAQANHINNISVLGFTGKDGVEETETDYISEKMGAYLAGHKKPALIELSLLEKVPKEAGPASAAGGAAGKAKMLRDIFSVDAVVTGTVFAAGEKLKILTRLIDLKTGRVLLAAQSESEREWPQFPEVPDMTIRWDSAAGLPSSDFRDAVSDPGQGSCAARILRLDRLNAELVDAKARYWADKMKEPGFSVRGLTKNPGSEITDPETKAGFYKLLGWYYKSKTAAPLGPDELTSVLDLLAEETRVGDDCGHR